MRFVVLEEREDTSGCLLGFHLFSLEVERTFVAETGMSGVMEVGEVEGITSES